LCAGRSILGAIPSQNLAARTIEKAGAGLVVPPTDEEAFLLAAKRLRSEDALRDQAGCRARAYAETTFDTDVIVERFSDVIYNSLGEQRVIVL
jgi:glycosyltransferase involved in cell wall biosynthesis